MIRILRKEFTSKRTKQLRERLMLEEAKKQGIDPSTSRYTKGNIVVAHDDFPHNFYLSGPGQGHYGVLDSETAGKLGLTVEKAKEGEGKHTVFNKLKKKLGLDPKKKSTLKVTTRDLTKEELEAINKKEYLDELKRSNRKQNKIRLGDNPDKLQQKVQNKRQSVTINSNGNEVGRAEFIDSMTEKDIRDTIKKMNDDFADKVSTKEVSAFDHERQQALKEFREKKNHKTANQPTNSTKSSENSKELGNWIKQNPGKSAVIGLAGVGAVAGGIALYKHHKNKKKKEENDKK